MGEFSNTVSTWVREAIQDCDNVLRDSTRELVEAVKKPIAGGGNMPVDTSFLMNSLAGSLSSLPQGGTLEGGRPMTGLARELVGLASTMKLGQTLYMSFLASYAAAQNYGYTSGGYSLGGHHFLELGAQRWSEIVNRNAKKHGK